MFVAWQMAQSRPDGCGWCGWIMDVGVGVGWQTLWAVVIGRVVVVEQAELRTPHSFVLSSVTAAQIDRGPGKVSVMQSRVI